MFSRTRGYLPHLLSSHGTYFITFRLDDCLPVSLLLRWKTELEQQKNLQRGNAKKLNDLDQEYFFKIDHYLDTNSGCCWLKHPNIARLVADALRYYEGRHYSLHTWTIMPNHVHVLFTALEGFSLGSIVHSWKSFKANQANRLLCRSGRFWQPEYYD